MFKYNMQNISSIKKPSVRKSIIFIFLAIIAVLLAGLVTANSQAESYTKAKQQWQKSITSYKDKNGDLVFSYKMVVGRSETDQEVKALKNVCSANAKRLSWVQKNNSAPTLGGNPLGFLSGSYREASSASDSSETTKLVTDLSKNFSDFDKLCTSYILQLENGNKLTADVKPVDQYLVFGGNPQDSARYCSSKSGCLPDDKSLWPKIADYYQAYTDAAKKDAQIYKDHCFADEYKTVCDVYEKYYTDKAKGHQVYNDAIRQGSSAFAGFASKLKDKYTPLIEDAYMSVNDQYKTKYKSYDTLLWQDLIRTAESNIQHDFRKIRAL